MLLAPASTSALFSRKISTMIATSAVIGTLSVYAGLLLSYHLGWAAGAATTFVATLVFFAAFAAVGLRKDVIRRRGRARAGEAA
jgi:ABC-type Mn2+/Zn2+ transport system permease subunit